MELMTQIGKNVGRKLRNNVSTSFSSTRRPARATAVIILMFLAVIFMKGLGSDGEK